MPEHTELTWLLSSVTSVGQLNRMHQFRDKSGAARDRVSAGLLYYPVLMAADVLAYRAHEVPVGEDQREHIELMRDVALNFNKRFGDTLVVPEGNIPTVGARVRDLKEPDKKMSTTGGTPAGTVYVDEEPESIVKKFKRAETDSGREIVSAEDKPGITNMIEILAVVRGVTPADIERDFEGKGYGDFKGAVGTEVAEWLSAGARALPRAARGHRRDRGDLRDRRREGARDRVGGRRGRARADGRRARPDARLACPVVRIAQLELDLDVFAGPFDLLLSLILREELDLLEVDLAEVVIAYLDHLESQDQLDLESATEFLVLIAALLELKSRLMLPGEEVEELDELGPAEAAEELIERMLQYARFRAAGTHLARAATSTARPSWSAPRGCPRPCASCRCRRREAAYDPAVLGAALGGLLRVPKPIDLSHIAMPRVTVGERLKILRDLLRRGRVLLRGRGQGRRPRDGLRDRVRAARALQERRGRLGAGRAVRPDHGDRGRAAASRGVRLDAQLEALLFLAPEPVTVEELADALQVSEEAVTQAAQASSRPTSRAAGSSCAGSRVGSRSPRTRTRRRPRGACSPARARRR